MKKKVAIFGYPLKRTLSPLFQNAGFRALKLPLEYAACPVEPEKFAAVVEKRLAEASFAGANITVPHKEMALKLLFKGKPVKATPVAKAIGAANTLFRKDGGWVADNTDAAGFLAAAKSTAAIRGKRVLIAGSGGSARAAAYACLAEGAARVWVSSRSRQKALEFCRSLAFKGKHPFPAPSVLAGGAFRSRLEKADWVVNTIPGDDFAAQLDSWVKKCGQQPLIFDLSYFRSPLGLAMLFEQGVRSFEQWTGKKAPREAMWKVLAKEVGKNLPMNLQNQIAFSTKPF